MIDIRCPRCNWRGDRSLLNNALLECPNCGTKQPPLNLFEDRMISTNWADIRLLCIYAQRFIATFDAKNSGNKIYIEIVNRIIREMERFRPEGSLSLDPDMNNPNIIRDIEKRKQKSGGVESPYLKDIIGGKNG